MTRPKLMKVSDEERDRALQALSKAVASGRIEYADFEARVERALAATNYVELGDIVIDLPVRAPRPAPEPGRYDHLPVNAPARTPIAPQDAAGVVATDSDWPSRSSIVAVMGIRAVLGLLAGGVVDVKLLGDVLPSASLLGGATAVLLAVLVSVVAIVNLVACRAALRRT